MGVIINILKVLGVFILSLVGLAAAGQSTVDSGKDLVKTTKEGIKKYKTKSKK